MSDSGFLSDKEIAIFKKLIDGYKMSSSATRVFVASNFAVIAGPAGAGKDTIRDLLIRNFPDDFAPILSTTTRPRRPGEKDGVDYHFRPKDDIRKGLEQGDFFQTALVHNQQVSCLHLSEVQKLKPKQVGLSILIVQTEEELREIKPDIKTVFLIPPSLSELKRRLQLKRHSSQAEINRRMQAANKELEIALRRDRYYCLVNDRLELASEQARSFLLSGQKDNNLDQKARKVLQEIHEELQTDII